MRRRRHRDAGGSGGDATGASPEGTGDLGDLGDLGGTDVGPDGPAVPLPLTPRRNVVTVLGEANRFGLGNGTPRSEPTSSTPLDDEASEGAVPTAPLWAMKYLRHRQLGASGGPDDPDALRVTVGRGDGSVSVIDDGPDHCMVARQVGATPDGCEYCLVARVDAVDAHLALSGVTEAADLFALGRELTLCGVTEGTVSNVVRVAGYRRFRDVPTEYLPPSPFVAFPEPL